MKILIIILSIYVFIKTIYFGIYELKEKNNKYSGFIIIFLSFICLIVPTIMGCF